MSAKGPATRARIVDAAIRAASTDGIDGLTLGRVAGDVGMSKSGLFAHFASKEQLQVDVLEAAAERFAEVVVRPALAEPRGVPRLRALFDRWLGWERHESLPGGCVFMHAIVELDDRPGAARDALVRVQREWLATLARAVRIAVNEGHLRPGVDAERFAFHCYGLVFAYYHARRLLADPHAERRARESFEELIDAGR